MEPAPQLAKYAGQLLKASCASYAKGLAQLALCRSQLPEKRAYSWKLCVK